MKRLIESMVATLLAVAVCSSVSLASSVEVRLKDGSTWRGAVSDRVEVKFYEQYVEVSLTGELVKASEMYLIVKGNIAGELRDKAIFRDDVVSMKTVGEDAAAPRPKPRRAVSKSGASGTREADDDAPLDANGNPIGVFYLPLEGGVGDTLRHDEIEAIGEEADKYGPGQIIVLYIKSNGGLVYEAELINEAIADVRKRHRVVAWINKAVSAGCSTAMSCDEIYFQSAGIAGSVTTIRGLTAVSEEDAKKGIEHLAETAIKNGMSEHIARAMKLNKYMCSYDKDPVTGEVTFYGDLSGEFVLSDEKQNLCFNASNALHCGFSSGTADTEEDLAKLLNLPKWYEISDKGRKLAEDRQRLTKQIKDDIYRLTQRMNYYKTGSGDPIEILGARLNILRQLRKFYERDELLTFMTLGAQPEQLDRQIEEMRKQLADLRRAQRRR